MEQRVGASFTCFYTHRWRCLVCSDLWFMDWGMILHILIGVLRFVKTNSKSTFCNCTPVRQIVLEMYNMNSITATIKSSIVLLGFRSHCSAAFTLWNLNLKSTEAFGFLLHVVYLPLDASDKCSESVKHHDSCRVFRLGPAFLAIKETKYSKPHNCRAGFLFCFFARSWKQQWEKFIHAGFCLPAQNALHQRWAFSMYLR